MNTSKWLMSTAVTPHTHTGPPREQSAPVCILTRTKELPQSSLMSTTEDTHGDAYFDLENTCMTFLYWFKRTTL